MIQNKLDYNGKNMLDYNDIIDYGWHKKPKKPKKKRILFLKNIWERLVNK